MTDKNTASTQGEDDVKVPIDDMAGATEADDIASQIPGFDDMSPEDQERARAAYASADEQLDNDIDVIRRENSDLQAKLAEAEKSVEDAEAQTKEAKERLIRLQADWQNFRQRTAKERLDERAMATEKLVTNLLPVIDDLERAIAHADETAGDNAQLLQFVEGVSAVRDKLVGQLAKEGVEPIDPMGQAFDPAEHLAFQQVQNTEEYDETVCQVFQKGYRMGGKVIRSAMVMVTTGGPQRPAPDPEPEDSEPDGGDEE